MAPCLCVCICFGRLYRVVPKIEPMDEEVAPLDTEDEDDWEHESVDVRIDMHLSPCVCCSRCMHAIDRPFAFASFAPIQHA